MVLGGVTGRKTWPFWATIIRYHNSHSFTGCLMHCLLKIQNMVGKKEYKRKWLSLALARPQGCTHSFTGGCKQQELRTKEQDQSCTAAQEWEDIFFMWHSPSYLQVISIVLGRKRSRDQFGPSLAWVPFRELQQLQIVPNCSTDVTIRKREAESG